jgi:hypothetical protein
LTTRSPVADFRDRDILEQVESRRRKIPAPAFTVQTGEISNERIGEYLSGGDSPMHIGFHSEDGMADRPNAELVLSAAEQEQLHAWVRRRKTAQALAQRSRVVLECAGGTENKAVAAKLAVTGQTVSKWRTRFVQMHLDGLLDAPRSGAPRTIGASVPSDLDILLVMDHYGTHKTPTIRTWFACHPRFHVHFTPTSTLWLNQVERWFATLTEKQIRRLRRFAVQLEAPLRQRLLFHRLIPVFGFKPARLTHGDLKRRIFSEIP